MLGTQLIDEAGVERQGVVDGLGLLPVATTFEPDKLTRRVTARLTGDSALWSAGDVDAPLDAYEIHMGRSTPTAGAVLGPTPFTIEIDGAARPDGCTSADGFVIGTYMHGLLEHAGLRRAMLARLSAPKGVVFPDAPALATVDEASDTLADAVAAHLDLGAIGEMVGLPLGAAR